MKRVLVLNAQVPFERGGAELLAESLTAKINSKLDNVQAELVKIPFKWYPEEQILSDIMSWRLLDLSEANGKKIDLVIATKFPTYAARHSNKVLWLVHQHRQFYELEGTEYDRPTEYPLLTPTEQSVRNKVRNLDPTYINECRGKFSIAQTVSNRLKKYNGVDSTPLLPPPNLKELIYPGPFSDEIVYVGRLNEIKRPHLLVEALSMTKKGKVVIIGQGDEDYVDRLNSLIAKHKLTDRCKLLGFVSEEILLNKLSQSRAVFYAPFDEDYGYATIEAFLAKKPVITCEDSGEVASIVKSTKSGWVTGANAAEIAKVLEEVYGLSGDELESVSSNGHEMAKKISWDNILNNLVEPYL